MAQDKLVGISFVQIVQNGRTINVPVHAAGAGEVYAETGDLDFEKPNLDKYIEGLILDLRADEEIPAFKVYVGYRNSLKEDITWVDCGYVTLDNPIVWVGIDGRPGIEARFFRFKFVDESPVAQWKLSRIDVMGHICGMGRLQ